MMRKASWGFFGKLRYLKPLFFLDDSAMDRIVVCVKLYRKRNVLYFQIKLFFSVFCFYLLLLNYQIDKFTPMAYNLVVFMVLLKRTIFTKAH